MNEKATKRRDWIKNVAIVFLAVLAALTLFSNTIMNYSLPEVATVYVQPGSITSRVRGSAAIEAADPYSIVAEETRTIASVAVRVGAEIEKDAVLYYLDERESAELTAAEAELAAMELSFMSQLFTGAISSRVLTKVVEGDFYSFDDFKEQLLKVTASAERAEDAVEAQKRAVEAAHKRLSSLGVASGGQVALKDRLLLDVEGAEDYVLYTVSGILHAYGAIPPVFAEEAISEARTKTGLKLLYTTGEISEDAYNGSSLAYDQIMTAYNNAQKALADAIKIAENELIEATNALQDGEQRLADTSDGQSDTAADIQAEISFNDQLAKIEAKKAEIDKIREKSTGATVTSPVAGVVTSLSNVAGETFQQGSTIAVIQVAGKGFTAAFSVTNEQASKVQVGDPAEISGGWWWSDMALVLAGITPDPANPGQRKMLFFTVSGSDIQAGQQLNISVGQRSATYDLTVPNSAIREDSNGKFILVVETRSTPLSNRYYAVRADVEVVAEDDNNSAVIGAVYAYSYVITTATKPVEPGQQIRLTN